MIASSAWRRPVLPAAIFLLMIALGLLIAWLAQAAGPPEAAPLGTPAAIAPITPAQFDTDKGDAALRAVGREAQRRLFAAKRYPGQARGVLPDPLRHLHAIITCEDALAHGTSVAMLAQLAASPTPLFPRLADLAEAYQAVDQPGLAALAQQAQAAIDAGAIGDRSPELTRAFLAAMAEPGLAAGRIAYARSHREAFLAP